MPKTKIVHTFQSERHSGAVAALIYFDESVSLEQADAMLAKLSEQNNVTSIVSGTYNPEWGAPVWYIP
jgi:hypothetical protein